MINEEITQQESKQAAGSGVVTAQPLSLRVESKYGGEAEQLCSGVEEADKGKRATLGVRKLDFLYHVHH